MRVARPRFRAALITAMTAALALAGVPVPVAAAPAARAAAAPAASSVTGSDRAKVALLWRSGGPATKRDAELALAGTDADVTRFLTTLKDPDAAIDRTVQVSRMISAGGAATRSAGQAALDAGTDDALAAFLQSGWDKSSGIDLSVRVSQVMSSGGAEIKKAGQQALDAGTSDALRTFLDSGWQAPFEVDQTVKVSRAIAAGGPEVKKAGQQALDAGTLDALNRFLITDLPVAQARDAETESIAQLVSTAQAAADQAASQTQQAKEESDKAVAAAAAAQKAAQQAKDAAAAAQGHASEATDAANRAAYAAEQASVTARQAIGAANAATASAHTAAVAASRAAGAASQAGRDAAHAYDAAATALGDSKKASDAAAAAHTARASAESATTAANAARAARTASQQAVGAGQAAVDAANQSRTAAQAATDAANNSAAAGADARQALAAAARARAQAARAVSAAQSSQAWANQASTAAGEAADAADAAAADANRAADAAAAAAVFKGAADEAARKATDHANAATAAANTAANAAQQAAKIAQVARKADDDRITLAGQQSDDAAFAAAQASAAQPVPPRWDLDQATVRDAETNRLIAEANAAGTPRATVVADARRVALKLSDTGGSWTKAAALTAVAASDDEAVDYISFGLGVAAGQDDRVVLAELAEKGTAGFKTAAASALAGSDDDVRNFLRNRDYPGRLTDDTLQVSQIMSAARAAGRTVVVQQGQAALDAGTGKALRDFLDTGQYTALKSDDQVKVSQVQSAARAAGYREVVAGAQAALDGPPTLLHEFLTVGQFSAAQRDQNTAAHNAAVDSLLAQATTAAADAAHDAYEAQAAAARARQASDDAAHYLDQANAAAADANTAADRARQAADRAAASAQQAQASAKSAAAAAATATAAADQAGRSAASAVQSAAEAAGYARDAAKSAHDAYQSAVNAGKSASDAAKDAHAAWASVFGKLNTEKQQFIDQRKQSCQPAMRTGASLDFLSPDDCVLLLTGSPADKDRILHHLQDACRQLNPANSLKTNECLQPENLYSANFAPRYPDPIMTSGGDPVGDIFLFVAVGLISAACDGVCDLLGVLSGAGADLGLADTIATTTELADAMSSGKSVFDVLGTEINAELGAMERLSQEATADAANLAKEGYDLTNVVPCGTNSFTGATPVLMADGTAKPIKDVQPGDRVSNAEPGSRAVQRHAVTAVHVTGDDRDFDDLAVAGPGGTGTVTTTAHHLFWDKTTDRWTAGETLRPGEKLDTPGDGSATVTANRRYSAALRTYNLTVEGVHTYYVLAGSVPLLVHNTFPCPPGLHEAWHEGNFVTREQSFEYHYKKHSVEKGVPVSPEQYLADAKAWAETLKQPGGTKGLNASRRFFDDGQIGVRYVNPNGGLGGIIGPDGRIVSFWYE